MKFQGEQLTDFFFYLAYIVAEEGRKRISSELIKYI